MTEHALEFVLRTIDPGADEAHDKLRDYSSIRNVDGVGWWQAKVPPRWHRCKAQTTAMDKLDRIERCACGAIRWNGRAWIRRNERRQSR